MRWFRFYSEALYDPKVQRLSGPLFKTWVNILLYANLQEPRGTIASVADLAYALRLSEKQALRSLATLEAAGLIDTDTFGTRSPHNWTIRQPSSDDAAERMANKRRTSSEQVPTRLDQTRTDTEQTRFLKREREETNNCRVEGTSDRSVKTTRYDPPPVAT